VLAAVSGVAALVCGVLAWAQTANQAEYGLIAGVTGMIAGVLGLGVAIAHQGQVQAERHSSADLESARRQLAETEAALAEERRGRAEADQKLQQLDAELIEARTQHAASHASDAANPPAAAAASDAAADTPPGDVPGGALTDVETGLFSEAYFRVALDARIASARRHLRPVATALLQVVEGVGTATISTTDPVSVSGVVRDTLRDADTACRLANGSFALILEDTPENGAVWTVERIRRALASRHPNSTLWAGVACYPAHAFSTEELLEQGHVALEAAKEWSQDRIEVATAE
jgi:two-component system cell cycle response regulator